VTLSIGITDYRHGESVEQWMERADHARVHA
jgi:PleD family two-component response regulator